MSPRAALLGLFSSFAFGCGSAPEVRLDLLTEPQGVHVYLSRSGTRAHTADIGFFEGDIKTEPWEEEYLLLRESDILATY